MQWVFNVLISSSIYSMIGLGFWMLCKTQKFFNLGHGATILIGGYTAFFCSQRLFSANALGISVSVIVGCVVACAVGMLFDASIYRLLRRLKRSSLVLLVVSLGLMTIVQNTLALGFTSQYLVIDTQSTFSRAFHIFGGVVTLIQLGIMVAALCSVLGLHIVLTRTGFGKAFRAIADDSDVAAIVGLPVERVLLIVAGIAAGLGGLVGGLKGVDTGILPLFGFGLFLKAVASDIVGGMDRYWGVVIGALIVATLEQVVVVFFGAHWRDVGVYALLFIFLLVRPQGMLATR